MSRVDNLLQFPESVERAACEWVAKLDRGNLSHEEKTQLSDWLTSDPQHRIALADQMAEWSEMDLLSELTHLAIAPAKLTWVDQFNSVFGWNKPAPYMAGLVVLASVGFFAVTGPITFTPADSSQIGLAVVDLGLETAVGERISESLPDGSVVHINTTSAAEVSYSQDQRSVQLMEGEAFFNVASELDRPFVVYAGETSIRAVGTAFAVHLIDGAVQVSVTEGTVEFSTGGQTHLVSADPSFLDPESAAFAKGNVALYSGENVSLNTQPLDLLERRLAWHSGMLEFKGDSLDQIIEQVSRYTEAEIEILDEDIRDVRLGGYFRIGDIEGLASALEVGFNIQVSVVSDNLIQISRGSD
jgi:transmembrane sensor